MGGKRGGGWRGSQDESAASQAGRNSKIIGERISTTEELEHKSLIE